MHRELRAFDDPISNSYWNCVSNDGVADLPAEVTTRDVETSLSFVNLFRTCLLLVLEVAMEFSSCSYNSWHWILRSRTHVFRFLTWYLCMFLDEYECWHAIGVTRDAWKEVSCSNSCFWVSNSDRWDFDIVDLGDIKRDLRVTLAREDFRRETSYHFWGRWNGREAMHDLVSKCVGVTITELPHCIEEEIDLHSFRNRHQNLVEAISHNE